MIATNTWTDVAVISISTLPAVIAAVSSLLNGREAKRVRRELQDTNGKIDHVIGARKTKHKAAQGTNDVQKDWYQPPDLL